MLGPYIFVKVLLILYYLHWKSLFPAEKDIFRKNGFQFPEMKWQLKPLNTSVTPIGEVFRRFDSVWQSRTFSLWADKIKKKFSPRKQSYHSLFWVWDCFENRHKYIFVGTLKTSKSKTLKKKSRNIATACQTFVNHAGFALFMTTRHPADWNLFSSWFLRIEPFCAWWTSEDTKGQIHWTKFHFWKI